MKKDTYTIKDDEMKEIIILCPKCGKETEVNENSYYTCPFGIYDGCGYFGHSYEFKVVDKNSSKRKRINKLQSCQKSQWLKTKSVPCVEVI